MSRGKSQGLHRSLEWNGSDQQTSAAYRIAHAMCTFPPMKWTNLHENSCQERLASDLRNDAKTFVLSLERSIPALVHE